MPRQERNKYLQIAFVCALMALIVVGGGNLFRAALEPKPTPHYGLLVPETIEGEAESFRLAGKADLFLRSSEEKNAKRNLQVFHSRRAFPGAPPMIPHDLLEQRSMGGKSCLGCHTEGGYAPVFKAHTPITPHPQLENCLQCHVPQQETSLFRGTSFEKLAPPSINQESLPLGPPPIPHELHMRENCLACHAGPGAVAEIRTTHPERVNCRQCHVPMQEQGVFLRGGLR